MDGDQQDAVDAAGARVLEEALPLLLRTDEGEEELQVGVGESAPTPWTISEKYGSAKNRFSVSGITSATASLRLPARARAARFGM